MLLFEVEERACVGEGLAEWPFDVDVFSGTETGGNGCEMSVYAHGTDYQIDVRVLGKLCLFRQCLPRT